jgi:hypothetical protein
LNASAKISVPILIKDSNSNTPSIQHSTFPTFHLPHFTPVFVRFNPKAYWQKPDSLLLHHEEVHFSGKKPR